MFYPCKSVISVLLTRKFLASWKEFFPEFSWDRTPLACMWWPLDCCCTLEACAPRNPGRLRVSAVKFFGCGYAAPGSSVAAFCAVSIAGLLHVQELVRAQKHPADALERDPGLRKVGQ